MAKIAQSARGFAGSINLPILSADTTLGDALDAMVEAKRSAVIVDKDGKHYLHTAKSVLAVPEMIHSKKTLGSVLAITGAPYLPTVQKRPRRLADLSPNIDVLVRSGVIGAVPQGKISIGGLIMKSGGGSGRLLALRGVPVKDLAMTITKCVCTAGDRVLPEQLINGACPFDGYPVDCG